MQKVREKLTFANVVACLALFVALGGASYAATQLPKNSVGTQQLKNGAVTGAKVKAGSLTASSFKPGQLPKGATGAKGPEGQRGPEGPRGAEGPQGPPGAFPSGNLPSGATLRGNFAIGTNLSEYSNTSVSFGFTLASAPTGHFIAVGDTPPPQCPGSAANPQASAGNLCVYEIQANNQLATPELFDPATGAVGAGRYGFGVAAELGNAPNESLLSYGSWAVTAP